MDKSQLLNLACAYCNILTEIPVNFDFLITDNFRYPHLSANLVNTSVLHPKG